MLQRLKLSLLALLCLVGAGFFLRAAYLDLTLDPNEDVAGTILVWHGWDEANALVLDEVVEKFMSLHPNAKVYLVSVERDELRSRFEEAAETGFGPDLLIGPNDWIAPLANANAIVPITDAVDETLLERFLPNALAALQYENQLYGLPQSIHTLALYYNRDRVETPATTLDELMAQARAGTEVGFNTSFESAFWGIRAFGGRLFDAEGRVVLDQGGFANWLNWLKAAQEIPTMILSSDQTALRNLFIERNLGYLVDSSQAWPALVEALGEENVDVVPLPSGPTAPPGPFLRVEALLFSAASSARQTELALELAAFLTNAEQQTTLMRQARQIPANRRVRINPRLNPAISAFATQARSAVPYPPGAAIETVLRIGNSTYSEVLEGLLTPAEAAATVTASINRALGFNVVDEMAYHCESVGDFTLWHTWSGPSAAALESLIDDFRQDCPNVFVRAEYYTPAELLLERASAPSTSRPDLLLVDHTLLDRLDAHALARPMEPLIDDELLQRYRPLALDAFRVQERLYGLPLALRTQALIYNRTLVDTPASTLAELSLQAAQGAPLALTLDFIDAFWGIPAFGGRLRDESGRVILDQEAFADWLDWLQEAQQRGALVGGDPEALDERFVAGEIAYRVAPSDQVPIYLDALGEERVGVAPLPGGPDAEAGPLVTVSGFVISSTAEERSISPMLAFIRYATRAETQEQLMRRSFLLPANANVDVTSEPLLAAYSEQLDTALLHPIGAAMPTLVKFGGDAYVWMESGVLSAQEAAAEAAALVDQANRTADPDIGATGCEGSGRVEFWHAWQGNDAEVLAQIVEQFNATCSDVEVVVRAVSDEALRRRFANADEGEPPALILAPSDWRGELVADESIEPIGALLDASIFRGLLPNVARTVEVDGAIYALPISVETTVLYVNRRRVDTPATTLDELLRQAQGGRRVVLLTDRSEALWGIGAFGGLGDVDEIAPTSGSTATETAPLPSRQALLDWLNWLQRARRTPGITIGDENGLSLATFAGGRVAYHTGGPELLGDLRAALGSDVLGVVPLPAGPGGPASPLLVSQALYLPEQPAAPDDETRQALRTLALYLTGVEAQATLMTEAYKIPVNRLVDATGDPAMAAFVAQTETALPAPSPWGADFVEALGAAATAVLDGELSAEQAVDRLLSE